MTDPRQSTRPTPTSFLLRLKRAVQRFLKIDQYEFTRESMNSELLRLQAHTKATAVLVTHNINEAVFMSDRIAVMTPRPGRLVGIIDVPFERPRSPELALSPEFAELALKARNMLELT